MSSDAREETRKDTPLLLCSACGASILLGPHTHLLTYTSTHLQPTQKPDDGVRCYAHIVDSTDTKGRPYYCSKITSLKSYLAMNREVRLRLCV